MHAMQQPPNKNVCITDDANMNMTWAANKELPKRNKNLNHQVKGPGSTTEGQTIVDHMQPHGNRRWNTNSTK
jgi:hypothetical protein